MPKNSVQLTLSNSYFTVTSSDGSDLTIEVYGTETIVINVPDYFKPGAIVRGFEKELVNCFGRSEKLI